MAKKRKKAELEESITETIDEPVMGSEVMEITDNGIVEPEPVMEAPEVPEEEAIPVPVEDIPIPEVTSNQKPDTIGIVYVGTSEHARRIGTVTGAEYHFIRDRFGNPVSTEVNRQDAESLLQEKGDSCVQRLPETLFLTHEDWTILQ